MTRSLLKDNALFFEWAMRLLDPLLVAAVGAAAYWVYLDDPMLAERYTLAIIGMTFACAALFPFVGLYSSQRGVTLFEEVRRLVNAWLLLATAWFAFLFLSKTGTDFSRVWSIYWIIAGFLVHLAVRGAIRVTLRMLRRRGYNVRRIAIVGAGEFGREIAQRIGKMPWSGLHVRGFYDDEPPLHRAAGAPFLGAVDQLLRDLAGGSIDQVWIALPLRAEARIREVLEDLRHYSVQVRFVPDIFDFALLHHSMSEIAGLPVINLTESPLEGANLFLKQVEDFVVSLSILVIVSPLMLLIAVGVKLSSPGPVFYRQERVTWNGGAVPDTQIPHDADRCRGGVRSGLVESLRKPGDAFRRVPAANEPGRIAPVHQCPSGRNVGGRPAARAAGVRRAIQAGDPRLHAEASGQGRHHRLGASQRFSRRHRPA